MRYSSIRVLVRKNGELLGEVSHFNLVGDLQMIICYSLFQACKIYGVADSYEVKVVKED